MNLGSWTPRLVTFPRVVDHVLLVVRRSASKCLGALLSWPMWVLGLCGFVVRVGSPAASLSVAFPFFALLFSTAGLSIWQSLNCKGSRPKNQHLKRNPLQR